jgi:hypothetical protein
MTENGRTTVNSDDLGPIEVPKEWPGAIGSFKLVRPYIVKRIWTFVILIVGTIIVEILIDIIARRTGFLGTLLEYLVDALLEGAVITMYFAALKDKELTIEEALRAGAAKFVNVFFVLLIVTVLSGLSFLLLVVPFFFVFPRLILAPYILIGQDLSVGDAITDSWNITKGHLGEVYGVVLLSIAIALLFITIIGIPFAIYWEAISGGSFALLSIYLLKNKPDVKTSTSI